MRDIKFRAWNEVEEKMLNWYEFLDTNMKNTFIAPESTGLILMQYTGLKDKKGKEIYEGDIIKIIDIEYHTEHIAIIEFLEASFILHMLKGEFAGDILGADNWLSEEKEVIGNIYDNPELLEKGE